MLKRFAKLSLFVIVFMLAAGIGTYATIHLLIRSDQSVVVPELSGKDVVYALEVLSDLGLNTKVKGSQFHPEIPKNHIISQSPDPGSEIKTGRDVRLVISKGIRSVVYPNVTEMDLSMADIIIEENDLNRKSLSFAHSDEHPKGRVMTQYPAPGTKGFRGDDIDMLVSAGPPVQWLRMTDLKGLQLDEAIEAVENQQLTVGTIKQVDNPSLSIDTVVSQDPENGFPVQAGTAVDLTVNRRYPIERKNQRRSMTLFRYRVAQGFMRPKIRVRVIRPDAAVNVFDDFVKPGEEIWLAIFRDVPTALFLYLDDELILTKHFD